MEILNHKKEKMQVVKKILIIIIFANIFQSCFSQKKLIGKYIRDDASLSLQDIGSKYLFNADKTFIQTDFFHLEKKEIFEGTYKLNKDFLILHYKPRIQQNNNYKFIKKRKISEEKNNNYLFTKMKLTNKKLREGEIELLVYDKKGKLLMGFSSNKNGEFPFLSLYDTKIGCFIFSSLVYQEVKIPAEELFGYLSEIDVLLEKTLTKYSQRNDTVKYLINSINNNKLELKNIKTKEKIILIKE
ncbi:MAG: hypothetical protein P8I51_00285 [Polaribacter sp.]|nr:hypothetical protein [Polaribacter sp.]MDG1953313.1 hypothetical protein [Polaribacter sp.]